jgi:hypothetical protein
MWGRRKKPKRCSRLSRQLALGRLEDALARVEEREQQQPEPETTPYPGAPARPAAPSGRGDLQAGDVPADTSAGVTGPGSGDQAAADDDQPPRQVLAPRTARSTHRRSFG